jgi:hypothetical protein
MVIYGYSLIAGTTYFDIDDPIYGKSHLTVNDFSTNYQGSGTWTHTYFTKSYFKLPIKFFYPKELILRRIWEARPLLNLKRGDLTMGPRELTSDADASLGLAHRVFTLGLDALRGERAAMDARPAGVRVYEMAKDAPQAYFDVTDDDEPRVVQMSAAAPQLEVIRPRARSGVVAGRAQQGGGGSTAPAGAGPELRRAVAHRRREHRPR